MFSNLCILNVFQFHCKECFSNFRVIPDYTTVDSLFGFTGLCTVNPFLLNVPFLSHLKKKKTLGFFIFSGCIKRENWEKTG